MKKKMRVMTQKPLNAETPTQYLRTWITDNDVFFKRNQGQFMDKPIMEPIKFIQDSIRIFYGLEIFQNSPPVGFVHTMKP